jgi:hypothetical protein
MEFWKSPLLVLPSRSFLPSLPLSVVGAIHSNLQLMSHANEQYQIVVNAKRAARLTNQPPPTTSYSIQ